MLSLSKYSTQSGLSHAQLESLVVQRTIALQNLTQRLLKVQDEERRRVARDLHDSTGQTLTALKMSLADLARRIQEDQSTSGVLCDLAALADQALQEIRTTSYLLHPPLLDEAGFAAAAQWYVEAFAKRSGIKANLDFATELDRLPIHIETALFRVLQESLTNVHRHSGAPEVSVCFQRQPDVVMLEIADCGRGIPTKLLKRLRQANADTGVGLAGMRERLNELNGKLVIESDGHGTSLCAMIPLAAMARTAPHKDCRHVILTARTRVTAVGFADDEPNPTELPASFPLPVAIHHLAVSRLLVSKPA